MQNGLRSTLKMTALTVAASTVAASTVAALTFAALLSAASPASAEPRHTYTTMVLEAFATGPFIFNLGHGILPDTPVANVERMLKRIRG